MVRKVMLGCLLAVAVPVVSAQAPQDQGGRINLLFIATPKAGMTKQLDEGLKRHAAWHAGKKDTRSYSVSVGVFGDAIGKYRVSYGNLRWEDLDTAAPLTEGDQADLAINVTPYVESVESRVLLRLDSLSRIPATEPAKSMSAVTYVFLNPGKGPEYAAYLGKLREAHDKANSTYRYFVLTQITGADGPLFVIVRPLDKFAENGPVQNRQVLVAAFGELEADRLLNVPDEAVRRTVSFISARRRDLGYTPSGQ